MMEIEMKMMQTDKLLQHKLVVSIYCLLPTNYFISIDNQQFEII